VFFGGFLAVAKIHRRRKTALWHFLLLGVFMLVVVGSVSFVAVTQAQGYGEVDSSTIGIGSSQSSNSSSTLNAEERLGVTTTQEVSEVSEAMDPADGTQRSITVEDPDPVIVPVALDYSNSEAVEKANQVCTLDPLPTAPHVSPDVSDGTWSSGIASAYNVSTNDNGAGVFGVTTTASGRAISESSVTVAVPASQSYLLGRVVEICYNGQVVIATVTDTGGFAKYGRSLDLAPGVYHALGASSPSDWGTRTIYYRFL
jgi:rare lipoprotein A (peptidoglycan hydrolase)